MYRKQHLCKSPLLMDHRYYLLSNPRTAWGYFYKASNMTGFNTNITFPTRTNLAISMSNLYTYSPEPTSHPPPYLQFFSQPQLVDSKRPRL